jgi:hypothetical protein
MLVDKPQGCRLMKNHWHAVNMLMEAEAALPGTQVTYVGPIITKQLQVRAFLQSSKQISSHVTNCSLQSHGTQTHGTNALLELRELSKWRMTDN